MILLKKQTYLIALLLVGAMFVFNSCKDEDPDDDNTNDDVSYALIIENGAQTINPDEQITYSAVLVDVNGNVSNATNVSWSVSSESVATISQAGVLTPAGTGDATVTASVTVDGETLTASVPVGVYLPGLFVVAPAAILFEAGHDIPLEVVYFTDGQQPTYSYSSSNNSVATVSNTGVVSLISEGSCTITVTASTMQNSPVTVPVMVIGPPEVQLPVTRVELNHYSADLFKNETLQLTPTAYNPDGIVNDVSFSWVSANTDIATVDQNGLVSPVRTGETQITVTANGVFAKCDLIVNPDTIVIVNPFYKEMSQGESYQFTATAYQNLRTGFGQQYNIDFAWMIPNFGPGFEMFNIGTVDNNGNVTISNDAMPGMMSLLMAYDPNNEYVGGGAAIMISVGGFGF